MDITSSGRKLENKALGFYGHTERMDKGLQKNKLHPSLEGRKRKRRG
jgi:hypothetical protein